MTEQMKDDLLIVAKALNETGVKWAVGASLMLHTLGIVEEVHDIDLFVVWEDIEKAIQAIEAVAIPVPTVSKDEYGTRYFHTFHVGETDLDLMSVFRIRHSEGMYEFPLSDENIVRIDILDGVKIPYTAPEDWLVAYMLMVKREEKVRMIEAYLDKNGVRYPHLLSRAMEQDLPEDVKKRIKKYIDD